MIMHLEHIERNHLLQIRMLGITMSSWVLCLVCAVLLVEAWPVVATADAQDLQSAAAWNNIGIVFSSQGNLSGAINAYNKAVMINPSYAEAWANMGVAFYNNSSYIEESIRAFDNSTRIDPTKAWVWYAKGSAYYKLGDYPNAIMAYNNAINLNPNDANVWADKGYALYNNGNYTEAIQAFDNSTRIDPTKAWVWIAKGNTYFELGNIEKALDCYDKAIVSNLNASSTSPTVIDTPKLPKKTVMPTEPVISVDTEGPKIEITSPVSGEKVSLTVSVKGTIDGELPDDRFMWILVNPHSTTGLWWPQGGDHILPYTGKWHAEVTIGQKIGQGGTADIGKEFDIAAVLVNGTIDQIFIDWVNAGKLTGEWNAIRLPKGTKIIDLVTVIRK